MNGSDAKHLQEEGTDGVFVTLANEVISPDCQQDDVQAVVQCVDVKLLHHLYVTGHLLRAHHVVEAAKLGYLNCVKYLLSHGAPLCDEALIAAAQAGYLECLKYLSKLFPLDHKINWECPRINNDNIECFIFAYKTILNPERTSLTNALLYDGTASLEYGHARGLPLLPYIYSRAACIPGFQKFDVFTCLHELGCRWGPDLCTELAMWEEEELLRYALSHGCPRKGHSVTTTAARYGRLRCLTCAYEAGCSWDARTLCAAAEHGHLDCLEYARKHGCPWDASVSAAAARAKILVDEDTEKRWHRIWGKLKTEETVDCLMYTHKQGCPWDAETCRAAAAVDNLECMKYAHEHGCPWDASVCIAAARWGHLICLQYAHENGCPWDARVRAAAASGSACEKYLIAQNCPIS